MIKSFRHKGIQTLFEKGIKAGVQPARATKLSRQLCQLNDARVASDMNMPGWRWHALSGKLAGHWAVWVSGNWRLTFAFDGEEACVMESLLAFKRAGADGILTYFALDAARWLKRD